MRLKSRQLQIPGGFKFRQPETGWQPRRFTSFEQIVNGLIAHRKANPALLEKHKWPIEHDIVADELDRFNAKICADMGWSKYIEEEGGGAPLAIPKFKSPSQQDERQLDVVAGRVRKIWAGVRTLNDWLDSKEPAVPQELSNQRAAVCVACPQNGQGDFTKWFTTPAAEAIRRQLSRVQERQLATAHDDKLNICEVCLCPLKLKVHTPLMHIRDHLGTEVVQDLKGVPGCWIIQELAQS